MSLSTAPTCGGRRLQGILDEGSPEMPLVTVVTATYNVESYIEGCIQSILQQDYPNIEYVVIDGGSRDGTVEILRRNEDRIAYWKSEPDRGIYDAFNKGIEAARGEWICFVGADDELLPGAISAYMALAAENPQAEFMSSRVHLSFTTGKEFEWGNAWNWKEFSRWMCTPHGGSLHRKSLFERYGLYDISYRSGGDYELLLRARRALRSAFLPRVTLFVRAGGASFSPNAHRESLRAKIDSGHVSRVIAYYDFYYIQLRRTVGGLVKRLLGKPRS